MDWTKAARLPEDRSTATFPNGYAFISRYTEGFCAGQFNWQVTVGNAHASGLVSTREQAHAAVELAILMVAKLDDDLKAALHAEGLFVVASPS